MEELFKSWTEWIAVAVEAAAVLVVALASTEAVARMVVFFARPAMPDVEKQAVRLRLARWFAVALEFALAADVLRTAIAPF